MLLCYFQLSNLMWTNKSKHAPPPLFLKRKENCLNFQLSTVLLLYYLVRYELLFWKHPIVTYCMHDIFCVCVALCMWERGETQVDSTEKKYIKDKVQGGREERETQYTIRERERERIDGEGGCVCISICVYLWRRDRQTDQRQTEGERKIERGYCCKAWRQ